MKSVGIVLSAALLISGLTAIAYADVPPLISCQGVLLDANDDPVTTSVSVVFTIYNLPAGGTVKWTETRTVNPNSAGCFSIYLGESTLLTPDVFSGEPDLWLGIKVESDQEMVPRTRLSSVGYANTVATVNGSTGGVISGDISIQSNLDVDGNITANGIVHSTTGGFKFPDGTTQASASTATGWSLTGNAGTNPATNYVGTSDGQPLIIKVAGYQVFRLELNAVESPNVIGGMDANYASPGLVGATICGGGNRGDLYNQWPNIVTGDYGTVSGGSGNEAGPGGVVGGGEGNTATGTYSVVPGGASNTAQGNYCLAAGRRAKANHDGSFVWGDATNEDFTSTGNDQFLIRSAGGVGIGTDSPTHQLDVQGDLRVRSSTSTNLLLTGAGDNVHLNLVKDTDTTSSASIVLDGWTDPGNHKGRIVFCTRDELDGSVQPRMVVNQDGAVGIGITTPSEKLTVKGNILILSESSGDPVVELGEGLDYAEGFDVAGMDEYSPGTVMVIDPANPGKLTISSQPYDSRVAGIIAGAKGLGSGVRLGAGEFDYDVALAGRVYCNVDASTGAVQPGDLLTTSPIPGFAMPVGDHTRAQGTILGKAMEALPEGEKGQILVLVTLQ